MEKKQTKVEEKTLPVGFIPTPTKEYQEYQSSKPAAVGVRAPWRIPRIPRRRTPLPRLFFGSRVLIWKQDPSVQEIGVRKAYLPGAIFSGPRDARIKTQGVPPVYRNAFNDFIEVQGTEAFDAVHTFAVVRQTLTMWQRCLQPAPVPWQWNGSHNVDAINLFPRAGETMNAYYSRSEKALKFFYFNKPGEPTGSDSIYTCRSFDIVAHEAGHAILDGLRPGWLGFRNPPQTGGLHESFGDLSAIFLALSQLDQVEAIIAQTKANLHDKTFLADLAEEFGQALGRTTGLRNADNNLKLSEAGTEVHAISQVFTGAIYDIMADIFSSERRPVEKDDAITLHEVAKYVCSLVMRAIIASPATGATFADVANQMRAITAADGKPDTYQNSIEKHFTLREVFTDTPLGVDHKPGVHLVAHIQDDPHAEQDRHGCCGTMQLYEYMEGEDELELELEELKKTMAEPQSTDGGSKRGAKVRK